MNRKKQLFLSIGLVTIIVASAVFIYLQEDTVPPDDNDTNPPPPEEEDPTIFDLFDEAIIEVMADWGVSQGSFSLVNNGTLLHQNGFGIGFGNAITNDTLFRIGEASMTITAVGILKLVENGDLSLSDLAFPILNQFSLSGKDSRLGQITVRHLLSHTSGWDVTPPASTFWFNRALDPTFRDNDVKSNLGLPSLPVSVDNIIQYAINIGLDSSPGSLFSINNVNYLILGKIIEKITGETYEDWVKTNILAPVGITTMRLAKSLEEDRGDDEAYHTDAFGGMNCVSTFDEFDSVRCGYGNVNFENLWAAAGWLSNSDSLVKFFSAIDYDPTVPDILSTSSLDLLYENANNQNFNNGRYNYYGLGFEGLENENGTDIMTAGVLVTVSSFAIIRSDGYMWAMTFNEHPVDVEINTGEDFQITFRAVINGFITNNSIALTSPLEA